METFIVWHKKWPLFPRLLVVRDGVGFVVWPCGKETHPVHTEWVMGETLPETYIQEKREVTLVSFPHLFGGLSGFFSQHRKDNPDLSSLDPHYEELRKITTGHERKFFSDLL